MLLEGGALLRASRYKKATRDSVSFKSDQSPTTAVESDIEALLRRAVAASYPPNVAIVVGEEMGGVVPTTGVGLAIDPVDGTWAFLTGTETFSTAIAVFRDSVPFLGMVMNPATGEIGYAASDRTTRLVHLSLFGEPDNALSLPVTMGDAANVLVNLHPSRSAASLVGALYDAWQAGGIRMVRSPGGSPSSALLEAAKGGFVYVNLWSKSRAEAYDLAAGVLLVRKAGGEVVNLEGEPIDAVGHQGPFVAAIDDASRQVVVDIAREVVGLGA
ncbi:MAG: inositol monophosphatase family protein [Acidimicrobiia bacterium]